MVCLGLVVLMLFAIPWSFDITAPGIAHPRFQQNIFSPFPARVVQLHSPGAVKSGTPLALFDAPDLEANTIRTGTVIHALNQRLKGINTGDSGIDQRRATSERLSEQLAEATAIREEEARLRVVADFDGIWLDVDPALRNGSWVSTRNQIGILVDPRRWVVDAYVGQREVERIQLGATARFRPEKRWLSVDAKVIDIDPSLSSKLSHVMLDARHGGPIATEAGDKLATPVDAIYRVRLELAEPLPECRETRGHTTIEGNRYSLLWDGIKRIVAVIIRESGF